MVLRNRENTRPLYLTDNFSDQTFSLLLRYQSKQSVLARPPSENSETNPVTQSHIKLKPPTSDKVA